MDSPETTKLTTSSIASESPPLQESPFSDFIKNLSPITHVKSTHNIVRGLSRLNSPPIVFKTPCTKHRDETSILARSESLQLLNPEASKSPVDLGKECEAQKGCESDVIGSFETHPSCSSGCVDEFLASPGDVDCLNSAKSATLSVKKYRNSRELDQSCSRDSKRTVLLFDGSNGKWVDAFLFSSEQTKSDQGEAKLIEIEAELNDGEWSYGGPNPETSFHGGHGFAVQTCQISQAQGLQNEHQSDLDYDSRLSAEPFPVQTFEDNGEDVRGPSGRLVDDIVRKGQKLDNHKHHANETHRGVRRRCLQFEESPLHSIGPTDSSLNHANKVNSLKRSNSSHVECNSTSETHISNLSQSNATLKHSRSSENITLALKPLGIGLHLNSIVSATSQSFTGTLGKKSADQCVGMGGLKSSMLENENTRLMPLSVPVKESVTIEETLGSTEDLISVSSVSDQFPHSVKDQSGAIDETGNSNSRSADVLEEQNRTSPKKKRKKAMGNDGADGCKRCSCRKTKCLKLYCDCFAAGVYCTDPCDCQGCFNKLEYKDKVLETREQIESRNPLAFAPKIVQLVSELPPDNGREDGNSSTPASARHKRGCNCKKSMCLKKYCECYQANVGCSSGCRCEGCKNVYGRKEEHVPIRYGETREATGNSVCSDSEMVEISTDLQCANSTNMHNLTPQTPSFQHSDHGKAVPKSRFLSERNHPSPDVKISASSSSYEEPTKSPQRNVENNYGVVFERCELSQGEVYNKGRLCLPISSTCDLVSKELSDTPIPMVSKNEPQNHQCSLRSDHLSSRYLTRHGSPLTPMTRLGGTEPRQCSDSGCEPVDILEDNETPVTIKVSSPNKKRVSPSMGHIYKLGSRSSGAPKIGRKFILKSVPSFPPLTPCIDSKGSSVSQDSNKPQDIN